jgi:hypothetical protein
MALLLHRIYKGKVIQTNTGLEDLLSIVHQKYAAVGVLSWPQRAYDDGK